MRHLSQFIIIFILFGLLLQSCKKDEDKTNSGGIIPNKGVLILNEGQFLAGNASIFYHQLEGKTNEFMFKNANDKDLGDVLQSVMETDNHYFLVLNNSGKIEVVNKSNLKSVKTIEGFQSPRYMVDLKNGKALVSNATFTPGDVEMNLDIVNLSTFTKEGSIKVNNWCEQMYLKKGILYVANTGKNQLLLIDPVALSVIDTIPCPSQPTDIEEDANGNLWVMCLGDFAGETAKVIELNIASKSIDRTIDLQSSFPQRMTMDTASKELYVLAEKLRRFSIGAGPWIEESVDQIGDGIISPYALGLDPENGNIFIGDAKDFSSKGSVTVYDKNGQELYSFETGVNPNGFIFR